MLWGRRGSPSPAAWSVGLMARQAGRQGGVSTRCLKCPQRPSVPLIARCRCSGKPCAALRRWRSWRRPGQARRAEKQMRRSMVQTVDQFIHAHLLLSACPPECRSSAGSLQASAHWSRGGSLLHRPLFLSPRCLDLPNQANFPDNQLSNGT